MTLEGDSPLPIGDQVGRRLIIDNLICDYGGVIGFGGATQDDGPLLEAVASHFNPSKAEQVKAVFNNLLTNHGMGLPSYEMDRVLNRFGHQLVPISTEDIMYADASSYWTEMETIRALNFLQRRGVRIMLASNTEASGWRAITQKLTEAGLNHEPVYGDSIDEMRESYERIISESKIPDFLSFIMRTRKTADGGLTLRADKLQFFDVIDRVAQLDRSRTAVWDDRPAYMKPAQDLGYLTFHTPNPKMVWEAVEKSFI
jgi:hypothetical protein